MRLIILAVLFLAAHSSAGFAQQQDRQQRSAGAPTSADDAGKTLATVEGRLTDAATGEPVRKATLNLMQTAAPGAMMAPGVRLAATTDAEGKFSFASVEPGSYILSAEKAGYLRQQYGSRNGEFGPGARITLKSGDRVGSIDFKLPRQAVIAGRVFDEDGEPVANAMVSVMRQQPLGRQPMMMMGGNTNDLGEFRIANLTPGKYFVRVQPVFSGAPVPATASPDGGKDKPRLDYVPTFFPNTTDLSAAAPIVLASGQQLTGADVHLRKARVYQVSGRLIPPAPGSRIHISIQPKITGRGSYFGFTAGGSVRPDGTFVIPSVQPGAYDLMAMNYEEGRPAVVGRTEITVSNQNLENVSISAASRIDIAGRVIPDKPETGTQPETNPLTGQVMLISTNQMPVAGPPVRIQGDGTFRVTGVSRDKFLLSVYGIPDQYVKSVMAGSVDITETGLDLSAAESAPPIEIRMSAKGAAVDGVVLDADGKPAIGSLVVIIPHPYDPDKPLLPLLRKTASTDQSGKFSIKAIAPGEYRLYAWDTWVSLPDLDPDRLKPFEKNAAAVKLKEGASQTVELRVNSVPAE